LQGQVPDRSAVLVESQAVQESLAVSDSHVYLVPVSSISISADKNFSPEFGHIFIRTFRTKNFF
jgi:archaellum component FlaF (FlaF/FlaG flagellin family)